MLRVTWYKPLPFCWWVWMMEFSTAKRGSRSSWRDIPKNRQGPAHIRGSVRCCPEMIDLRILCLRRDLTGSMNGDTIGFSDTHVPSDHSRVPSSVHWLDRLSDSARLWDQWRTRRRYLPGHNSAAQTAAIDSTTTISLFWRGSSTTFELLTMLLLLKDVRVKRKGDDCDCRRNWQTQIMNSQTWLWNA
jgi:hypothetical protein